LTIAPNTDYDSGTVIVNYRPTRTGKPAKINITPASAAGALKIINKTKTAKPGADDTFSFARRTGTNEITLSGKVPAGQGSQRRWVAVSKPQLVAATVFKAQLAKVGVTVKGTITDGAADNRDTKIARDWSMTLANLLVPFLKLSNNMHAETLVKTLATLDGRPGTWGDGTAAVMSYLRRNKIPTKGVVLVDGSGLAAADQLTARTIIGVLRTAQTKPWFKLFYKALPVAGNPDRWVGGTLASRMQDTPAANNLCGKTGTISGVTALSGYVTGADGRAYIFSMLSKYPTDTVTESQMKGIEDQVGVTLAGWDGS
jgi:D-alanyl-D-alanine carboxypeptidase/D-alanyl-D-alanine-endopeptidase (penicillin-binding protein 4)